MARRRFGVRAVSPEFGQHTRKVAAFDRIGRIRESCFGIDWMPGPVIGAEAVVPECAR